MRKTPPADDAVTSEGLVRGLGRWDATLLAVGSVIGLVFIAAGVPAYYWWRRHPTSGSRAAS